MFSMRAPFRSHNYLIKAKTVQDSVAEYFLNEGAVSGINAKVKTFLKLN